MLKRLPALGAALCLTLAHAGEIAIPLTPGLTITTALLEPGRGDYESTKRLEARQGAGWRITYRATFPPGRVGGAPERVDSIRLQRDTDLLQATTYRQVFESGVEEDYPKTTALGASTQVLRQLKQQGKSPFRLVESVGIFPAAAGQDGALGLANLLTEGEAEFKGELVRLSSLQVPVIVNGQLRQLPAIAAQGAFIANGAGRIPASFIFLDDEKNPLALRWSIGKSTLTVVRLDWPTANDATALGSELTRRKRIVLPGLYFDFGSATLKPESAGALKTIVSVLRNTAGPLRLEGHTDNLGAASVNQTLSLARVQAVKNALVRLEPSLASRLTPNGLGASRPVADNRTPEGRAQNRRVELVLP